MTKGVLCGKIENANPKNGFIESYKRRVIMNVKKICLNELYHIQGGEVETLVGIEPFNQHKEGWKRPALIVVPGGGYGMVSEREAEPVAFRFLAKGFQVFILRYLCAPTARYPEQLLELACTVDHIRKNSEKYGVNPKEIFAVGFSAGGHLVGNLSTDYMQAVEAYGEELDCKLTASGLSYPVISAKHGHVWSFDNLTVNMSEEEKQATLAKVYLDENVSSRTSPAFIWATTADQVVPVMNSISYANVLAKQGINFELHIYPEGVHGLSTCDAEINPFGAHLSKNEHWIDACASFFRLYTEEEF